MSGHNDFTFGSGLITTSNTHFYKAPILAQLLHSLPHYNITFHRTNSTFRPRDEVYLESLGILGSVPAALLIVSLFGLLLYLMTRCCDRKPRTAHSITSLKVTLSVVTVLCCAAIGLGLYGNDDLHNGLLEVLNAGRKVDKIVSSVRNHTTTLEGTLTAKIRPQLIELEDIFDQPTLNQTALKLLILSLNTVQGNVTIANNAAGDIRRPLMGIYLTAFLNKGDQWELIRWPGTVAVLACLLVLCAVLLVGVARHSRCALILFSVCGLLAVTGSWLMSGLYLSTSVAVGDLCMDPADYLASEAPNELPTDVLLYYTQCEEGNVNPFTLRLRESQNAINNARSAMSIVSKISLVLFKSAGLQPKLGAVTADLNICERILTQLTALVDCSPVYYSYLNATKGLCEGGLLGLVLMLIASFLAAILLTIMVWVDSHTWIYIRKRNDYSQVEEPSYVSHQPANQQQQQQANHYHPTMSRTLPRNMNNGPPVISGSHTLGRKQHEMMMAQQHSHQHGPPSAAAMRSGTLGRLPSHHHQQHQHHSPSHMAAGPNNAGGPPQSQQQLVAQHQQQMLAAQQHADYVAKYAHHHNQYHSNTPNQGGHPQGMVVPHHQHHYSDGHQIQLGGGGQQGQMIVTSNGTHHHSMNNNNGGVMMRRYQTIQRQPQNANPNNMMVVNNNSNMMNKNDIPIPSSNAVDSVMYERDKQIYKCSTLRQGGRFDSAKQPSILNCPLPEIPKDHHYQEDNRNCKTMQRSHQHPHAKAIPPPKILSPIGNKPEKRNNCDQSPHPDAISDLPPPPPLKMDDGDVDSRHTQLSTETSSSPTSSTATIIHQPNSLSQSSLTSSLPPPPPPEAHDDYAVTEL